MACGDGSSVSVWLCLPSKRPFEQAAPILTLWRKQGYKIALARDTSAECDIFYRAGLCDWFNYPLDGVYKGYARSVNNLALEVLGPNPKGWSDPTCDWVVCAGDDTEPDASKSADELGRQFTEHFQGTFGVVQFTGDRWGDHQNTHTHTAHRDGSGRCNQCGHMKDHYRHSVGAYIDRVAGSPWMGREFCLRANQGRGPLWPEYFHMGCDEELQAVATRLGVFWQRPDLIHLHKHWGRGEGGKMVDANTMPGFLKRANSLEEWQKYKALFAQREAAGFPGSEPLALQKEDQ